MYGPDDIVRSFRRTVAEMLGEPWALDLERKEVLDEARPAGVIEIGREQVRRARTSIPQGEVELFAPVTLTLYPELAEPRQAGRTARQLAGRLHDLMKFGADGPVFENGRPASGPERLPLYDYADVLLIGTAQQRSGPQFPHDVLWVEDYGAGPVQDPLDPERWTVVLEARLSWERPGRVGPDAPIAAPDPQTGHFGPITITTEIHA